MSAFLKNSSRPPQVWRQGDVFLIGTAELPAKPRVEHRPVLAEGEATGHAHRLADPAAGQVFASNGDLYLEVVSVVCPSTGRQYLVRVPPTMQTCHQAVAWTAGFDNPDDYAPIAET